MRPSLVTPEFIVEIDHDHCRRCKRCVMNCSYEVFEFKDRAVADNSKCVACHRCVIYCPEKVITVRRTGRDRRYASDSDGK